MVSRNTKSIVLLLIQLAVALSSVRGDEQQSSSSNNETSIPNKNEAKPPTPTSPLAAEGNRLEPRGSDRNFVRDIVERLHALDADIGKLIYNSSSMYSPNEDHASPMNRQQVRGGERFTEVLSDLDSLQDEIGVLVANATRARQYNILVRLRPLNNILYRIRHNLHLMRNSLVAITAVSSLEKIGNSVLDSTLQTFMKPDANLSEELGDSGNYDINLDRNEDLPPQTTAKPATPEGSSPQTSAGSSSPAPGSTTAAATTTTSTTPAPGSSPASTSAAPSSSPARVPPPVSRRPTQRPATRRSANRQAQRRTTTTTSTTVAH